MERGRSTLDELLYTREHALAERRPRHEEGQPWENCCTRENMHLLEGEHGPGKVSPRRITVYANTRTAWKEPMERIRSASNSGGHVSMQAHAPAEPEHEEMCDADECTVLSVIVSALVSYIPLPLPKDCE